MPNQTRRERERADRGQLIITAARQLAEAEGWEAVTTRRLAAEIEYSQPVLYSHFKGKDAIMAAVAVQGFAELAAQLLTARTSAVVPCRALADVAASYTAFAEERPALYDAMFTRDVDLPFAGPDPPPALHAAFDELCAVVRPLSGDDEPRLLTEAFWSGLHGLVTLTRSNRLPRGDHDRRLALLVNRFWN